MHISFLNQITHQYEISQIHRKQQITSSTQRTSQHIAQHNPPFADLLRRDSGHPIHNNFHLSPATIRQEVNFQNIFIKAIFFQKPFLQLTSMFYREFSPSMKIIMLFPQHKSKCKCNAMPRVINEEKHSF